MKVRDIQRGQFVRTIGVPHEAGVIILGVDGREGGAAAYFIPPDTVPNEDVRTIAVVVHDTRHIRIEPGFGVIVNSSMANYNCEPINFQFEGIDEAPQQAPVAQHPETFDSHYARYLHDRGITVQYLSGVGGGITWRDSNGPVPGNGRTYRIKPQE